MTHSTTDARVPLAIVGIGCRLPGGVVDPVSYWDLMINARSGIVEVPPDRWNNERYYHPDPGVPGRVISRWGGFVDGIDQFDAKFWGISPREAARMDPQQRWLLEVAWEALENAGIAPSSLEGSATGVFVGVSSNDYGSLQLHDYKNIDVHTNSGGTMSIASNRISYLLDLKGPSMSVDTACSSALTATVLACEHLWSGKCTAAMAGGVNALITPHASVGFSKAAMLSPSGQCYAFDSRADGYVRAEGAGMVLIKPLASAIQDGNPVYAVIRAAVANQDGRTSSMTVPGVPSQSAMLRKACSDAGVDPRDIAYIEAHGTGTPVGDPIEARAIGNVLGEERDPNRPCLMGSVKANIGHLESGSGIAGLIKTALVLHHRVAPPNVNFETPNPEIPFDELGLSVVQEPTELPATDGRTLAAINSFGFGGANAHLILESPPTSNERSEVEFDSSDTSSRAQPVQPYLLPMSARDTESLRNYARQYRDLLADDTLGDLCWSAATRKEQHTLSAVAIGCTARQMRDSLNDFLQNGENAEAVVAGNHSGAKRAPVAFVFTGQGAQWWAMGQQLLAESPLFRATVEEIDGKLAALAGWSLIEEMNRDESTSRIHETNIAQPAIFALQVGLAALWRSWGIEPAQVVGHSVGEVAAAYCAGIYSLDDAVTVIYHRSRLQNETGGKGGMLAAGVTPKEASELIGSDAERVQIAAINSPEMVTIAGDSAPLERIEAKLEEQGKFVRRLRVNYAFHTHQMDPIRDDLLAALADINPLPASVPFVSTVTGLRLDGPRLDAEYWWRNVRYPVLFASAIRNLVQGAPHGEELVFLELGPHPALQSSISGCLDAEGRDGRMLHSLQRKTEEWTSLARNVAGLHLSGVAVDWASYNRSRRSPTPLPRYPWRHESCWLDQGDAQFRTWPECHPLLGIRQRADSPTWEFLLDARVQDYIRDHGLWDSVVFPGAGYGEIGLAVARELYPDSPHAVEDLQIKKALFVSDERPPRVRVAFREDDKSYRIYSEPEDPDSPWELHAAGRLVAMAPPTPAPIALHQLQTELPDHFDSDQLYGAFEEIGFQFGPDFQHIRRVWRRQGEALAEIVLSDNVARGLENYIFHPALMDAGFQASWSTMVVGDDAQAEDFFYLPSAVQRIRCFATELPATAWMHCRLRGHDGKAFLCDIQLVDDQGRALAEIIGFEATLMERGGGESWRDSLFQIPWRRSHLSGSRLSGKNGLAPTSDVVDAANSKRTEIYEEFQLGDYYGRYTPLSHQLAERLVEHAMVQLGWAFQVGEQITVDAAVDALGVNQQHRRLAIANLQGLEKTGVLRRVEIADTPTPRDGDLQWVVQRLPQAVDVDAEFAAMYEQFPQYDAELDLLRASTPFAGQVMSGDVDPVELMFPNGSSERLDRFYARGGDFLALNALVKEAVAAAVAPVPERRALRILEVGAGTGSLTSSVIQSLKNTDCEYLFTDIGPAFVNAGKSQFAESSFMEFRTFDAERSPAEQNLPPGTCDIVLASNVLHATRDLRQTLANLKECLAPGGLLIFVDVVEDLPKWNNVFGLLKGWWLYEDTDLRQHSPLLSHTQWRELLSSCGFVGVDGFTTQAADSPHQMVFVAAKPTETSDATTSPAGQGELEPSFLGSPTSDSADAPQHKTILLFADREGVGADAAARIASHRSVPTRLVSVVPGDSFEQVAVDEFTVAPACHASYSQLLDAVGATSGSGVIDEVIHAWCLDHATSDGMTSETLQQAQQTGTLSGLALVQALVEREERQTPDVYFVTRLAQGVANVPADHIASSPLVGLARCANTEHSNFTWKLIDLEGASNGVSWDAEDLAEEVLFSDADLETAYRSGKRYVRRADRVRVSEIKPRLMEAVDATHGVHHVKPYRLETDKPGVLANLALNETPRPAPGPNEVEVQVKAGGVNFRDVMKALGIYPGNPVDLLWFGDDFAGVVERVGENVTKVRPGDEVAGMSPYVFRSYALVDQNLLFPKPPQLSFEQTATFPTVFLTAHYALNYLAQLQPGERILIHAGTGGVGQAAIQIAKGLKLEIFATAGTEEKRELLRQSGVPHVMNSRTLDFADEVMKITNGEGVDAVLNSLAGEFIPKSFSTLAPFGRFLEIGKVDIYNNTKLGLERLKDNISYFVIDLAQHLDRKPALVAKMFGELAERFAAGDYVPLSHKVFPITEVVRAFRYMAQGKHIGKNVLSFDQPSIPIGSCTQDGHRLYGDGTYLITGGAGGFGLAVAKWMASQGAKHLALLSRSGPRGDSVDQIEALRASGVEVADMRVDVTSADDVQAAVRKIEESMPPLRGVIHGAMVLEDEFLVELSEADFNKVLNPKMLGAWNLHTATLSAPLDHFICFSSYSAIVGAARQGNYIAGNVFLDTLTEHRRALGLPAMTINWGALIGAGFVDRNEKTAEYLELVGVKPLYVHEAVEVLGECMRREVGQLAAGRLDWPMIARLSPVIQKSPTFSSLIGGQEQGGGALRPRLMAATPTERVPLTEEFVAQQVAGVFGIETSEVDRDVSLSDLGLDSLMAVELMNRVEGEMGMKVPMGKVLSGPSVRELAASLLELFGDSDDGAMESSGSTGANAMQLEKAKLLQLPLTATQRFVWEQSGRRRRMQTALAELDGTKSADWTQAVRRVCGQHPILAARIVRRDDQWMADMAHPYRIELQQRSVSSDIHQALIEAANGQDSDEDLPLVQFTHFTHADGGREWLAVSAHPLVADRASLALLLGELVRTSAGDDQRTADDVRHYQDYMQWESTSLTESLSHSIQTWREALTGAPRSLPLGTLVNSVQATRNGTNGQDGPHVGFQRVEVDSDLSLQILVAAAQRDTSLAAMAHAALAAVLHRVSGQRDLLTGSLNHGRYHDGVNHAIGPFSRTLPVRTQIEPTCTWASLVETADKGVKLAREHQHVPADILSSELGLSESIESVSQVSVAIYGDDLTPSWQTALEAGLAGERTAWAGQFVTPVEIRPDNEGPVTRPVELILAQRDGELSGWWRFDETVIPAPAMARISELFQQALGLLVESPDALVLESLSVLPEEVAEQTPGENRIPGEPEIDFEAEARLDESLVVPPAGASRGQVLLTGATGFLGAFLLDELLRRTDANIVCLVRADDDAHALKRVRENFAKYQLDPPNQHRLEAVVGNLDQPLMGIEPATYDRLSTEIDTIYHNGAVVNLALPYRQMMSNVQSTRAVLAFAMNQRAKRLHYVSTFTVLSTNESRGQLVRETDSLPNCNELLHGYAQTKWVSERLVAEAARRGLETTIYRPGHITGDSRTGASNMGDLLHTIVLSSAQMGAAPIRDSELDLTPADFVAKALVEISRMPQSVGGVYHLTNPNPIKNEDFNEWMLGLEIGMELTPYEQWREQYIEFCSGDPALQAVAELVAPRILDIQDGRSEAMHPVFDAARTLAALASTDVACPPANPELLETYVDYLRKVLPGELTAS